MCRTNTIIILTIISDLYDKVSYLTIPTPSRTSILFVLPFVLLKERKRPPQSYYSTVTNAFNTLHAGILC